MKIIFAALLVGVVVVSGEFWKCDIDSGIACIWDENTNNGLSTSCKVDPVQWTCRKYKTLSERTYQDMNGDCFFGGAACYKDEELMSIAMKETKRCTKEEAQKLDKDVR